MSRSLSRPMAVVAFAGALAMTVAVACSDGKLAAPKSDQNFDDPDNPNNTMPGTLPDAATDAILPDGAGATCAKQADCTLPLRCIFPIALGCGTTGTCAFYTDPTGCAQKQACACDGTTVTLCTPDGYAPAPIRHANACADTGAPGDSGSPDDGSPE